MGVEVVAKSPDLPEHARKALRRRRARLAVALFFAGAVVVRIIMSLVS